ncbi:hypothetical protein DYB26_010891 [Aphanomyces astaci]|uniref:Uncharacterized protein n=1 Tax=Aphanomyces astaci TaxID=112090 RepID=A0A397EM92_APHAT|nr:hypothetical protein DYB31_014009 [Aphanomyces astaci]RHZ03857.1 hypothetical protein DYB26_010891 [Aphanomyces astaci]
MLDELMRSLEQDHQEWELHQESKTVVEVMTKSIKPESMKTSVQKQLQLQRTRRGRPQVPRREGGQEDAAKNNGRVDGKADAIVPKTAEPPAKKGCLMFGDMSHYVARCPKTSPGEAEML